MLIEIFLAIFIGILAGTITGLLPGIHINLISFIIVSLSFGLLNIINPIILVIFIVSMALTHTFTDFIPSVLLGCPDTDTMLSVLPGHELLKEGQGYEAIILTVFGSIAAIFIILFTAPIFIIFLPKIYPYIKIAIPYILILSILFLVFKEKFKLNAIIIIFLSGFLGIAVLNMPLKEPLLPLLTGLFGASNLILSIKDKIEVPEQKISKLKEIKLPKKIFLSAIFASLISSPLCAFLPGLGSGQAAVIGSQIIKTTRKSFLILLGATNTIIIIK